MIAQALGINRLGQIITALVAATMPMSLLQATSTQNDLAAALWLICFIVFALAWTHKPDGINAFALAASLGLALLTKEINYVYALPLCAWFAWQGIRTHRGKFLTAFFWCAIIIVLLNGPHWWRNFTLYHHPFASTQTNQGFLIEHHGFSVLWSNLYLNIANHLSTPFPGIDHQTQAWLQWLHQHLFNCAIESSPANAGNFSLSHDALHEDHAGNFLHLLLIMASMIMLYLRFRSLEARTRAYLTAVIGVFFSYLWFMKWQPFNNRLEILIFLLWTPLIALSLKQMCNKKQLAIVLAFIVIGSMPWVFANYSRPLIGPKSVLTTPRTTQYFANLKDAPFSNIQTVKAIANDHCDQIGIALGEDAWEYPLWVLFHQQGKQLRIERILGANIAFKKLHYPLGAFNPCAIITTGDRTDATITFNNNVYIPTLHTAFLTVYSDLKWYLYQHLDIYEKMKP